MKLKTFLTTAVVLLPTMLCANTTEVDLSILNITALTPTVISLSSNQNILLQYTVTNQSIPRTFAMNNIAGVTQLGGLANECVFTTVNGYRTFSLGSNQSCVFTLAVNGSQVDLATLNSEFPKICPFSGGKPSNFSCSIPCIPITVQAIPPATPVTFIVDRHGGIGAERILGCDVEATGDLDNCAITSQPFIIENPTGIVVNDVARRAYIANTGDGTVLQCPILPSKILGPCTVAFLNAPFAEWITLNKAKTIAYVSGNVGGTTVWECPILADGSFGVCIAHLGFTNVQGLALNRDDSLLYVLNNNNALLQCSTTTFACTTVTTPAGLLDNAIDLVATQFNDILKITVPAGLVQCSTVGGNVTGCSLVASGLPIGITTNYTGVTLDETTLNTFVNKNNSATADDTYVCPVGNLCRIANIDAKTNLFGIYLAYLR